MNIKFTDESLFHKLTDASLVKVLVGSRMYGLEHQYSDFDYLYVYATSDEELTSVFRNHHQLQYKDVFNGDHLFVNLHTFVANIVNGDSLLNFEALHSKEMSESVLSILYNYRLDFHSLSVVRSYLGRAKKDAKSYQRLKEANTEARKKKLIHLMRSLHFAKSIIDGSFHLTGGVDRAIWDSVINANVDDQDKYALNFEHDVDYVRQRINTNNQYLPNYMSVRNQKKIDSTIESIMETDFFQEKKSHLSGFDLVPFYESNENGIKYDS